jgi:hypothetical protein
VLPLPTSVPEEEVTIRDVGMTHRLMVKRVRVELIDVYVLSRDCVTISHLASSDANAKGI